MIWSFVLRDVEIELLIQKVTNTDFAISNIGEATLMKVCGAISNSDDCVVSIYFLCSSQKSLVNSILKKSE